MAFETPPPPPGRKWRPGAENTEDAQPTGPRPGAPPPIVINRPNPVNVRLLIVLPLVIIAVAGALVAAFFAFS